MTSREELIEKAREAILGVEGNLGTGRAGLFARAALAVFEKAHTPTDDERDTLRIAELDARQAAYQQDRTDWFLDHEQSPEVATNTFFRGWDAAVAAGFRRSEVPEPSAERYDEGTLAKVYAAFRDNSFGTTEATDVVNAMQNAGVLFRERGPGAQGEPSDADLTREFDDYRDAHPGWWRLNPYDIARSFWLAALRAAGGVR